MVADEKPKKIRALLQRGDMKRIADKLSLSKQAVGAALSKGNPSHAAVREALAMAEASGALAAAKELAALGS